MDLSELKEKHPSDEKRLDRFEKQSKIAELMLTLKDHGAIKLLSDHLDASIERINTILLSEREMDKDQRNLLLVERECWAWLSNTFKGHEAVLKNIENKIKQYED